ncbi:hypothetical protein C7M84_022276 [Penaeus vannamei]|uniref:CCHC-type domain-containing protein n=1 Tax=Penaeus vannamei TaxID=6689 RepID=A0A423U740_PENVA|nr:hypothetical protein C7M84_022276 [Penaeus vannamei]
MVTAAAATLPPLSTLQPRSEEVAEQLPRLPPPVTVSTQHPAPVASYLAPLLGGQPDADAGDRRDTLGHQWVAAATSREPASSSASGLQPPPVMLSGSVPGPAANPQPSVLPQPTLQSQLNRVVITVLALHWPVGRDEVPIFCGETPASQGIQRSQELESWISSIELSTRPATSEAYMAWHGMARSRVSGYAWSVLISPVFASIQDWVSFKAQLRDQFRGVATAQHFYDMLDQARVTVGQGPLDFFRSVELAVQQGVRDYSQDIGNAEGLMQRTFREGLPGWLRGQLLWHDFPSARKMAEKCKAVWDSVVGARHTLPDVHGLLRMGRSSSLWPPQPSTRDRMVLGLYHPGQYPDATTPGLEFYEDLLLQAALVGRTPASAVPDTGSQPARTPAATSPRRWSPRTMGSRQRPWCGYHRMEGHHTSDCRARRGRCYNCGETGHLRATCPFGQGRSGGVSQLAGGRACTTGTEQPAKN